MKLRLAGESRQQVVKLSVVVVSIRSRLALRACLDAIFANDLRDVEVLVVDCCLEEPFSNLIDAYPLIRILNTSQKGCIPLLAATGLRHAVGEIIAMTDTSCLVSSDWVANILRAHESSFPAIGGTVETKAGRMKLLDWSAYFCEYGQFMYPLKAGAVTALPGNNISIKRSELENSTEFVSPGFWKTLWCDKLRRSGEELICEPAIVTYYSNSFRIVPFLIRRYRHGRCFAGMRSKEMTRPKRVLYFAGSPLLSFVLLQRTVTTVVSKKRFLRELILSSPFLVLAMIFWSVGETWGYLKGPCHCCTRFLGLASIDERRPLNATT